MDDFETKIQADEFTLPPHLDEKGSLIPPWDDDLEDDNKGEDDDDLSEDVDTDNFDDDDDEADEDSDLDEEDTLFSPDPDDENNWDAHDEVAGTWQGEFFYGKSAEMSEFEEAYYGERRDSDDVEMFDIEEEY